MPFKDVMVDLETLGTAPGCVILSIGAVYFEPETGELGDEFYEVINRKSSENSFGLHVSKDTLAWWGRQSEEARAVLKEAESPGSLSLAVVLTGFNYWLARQAGVRVWGNGADFDNALLAAAYHATDIKPGWAPYNGRCYRTIKNLAPHVKLERSGTHHNALHDAKSQARHLMDIVRSTTLTLA